MDAIKLADKAMYCAKDAGRNKSIGLLPSPQAVDSPETITLENLADVAHSPLIQLVKTEAGVATRIDLSDRGPVRLLGAHVSAAIEL